MLTVVHGMILVCYLHRQRSTLELRVVCGRRVAVAPPLLAALLLLGWTASPCDAQTLPAADAKSIVFLNSTLNVRHAHFRHSACAPLQQKPP